MMLNPSAALRRTALLALTTLALSACGGGGGSDGAPQTGAASNSAPAISGSASLQAQVGRAYTFAPQASDADGDSLTFSIMNKPEWASFDSASGRLSGTPPADAVGSHSGVIITVSDGSLTASLAPFAITVSANSGGNGSARLSWAPPTQRSDGSALTNLAGYKIHYGNSPDDLSTTITVDNPSLSTYQVDGLGSGAYYFVVTSYDTSGAESSFSNVVSKTIA